MRNCPYYREGISVVTSTGVHTTGTRDNLPQYFCVVPQDTTAENSLYYREGTSAVTSTGYYSRG